MCCDRDLDPDEIKYNPKLRGKFDLCGSCLEVVKDCFEHDTEEEIEEALNNATVESLYELHEETS